MMRSFRTVMTAQFFSSLADNALFVIAIELLRTGKAPDWQGAALVPVFAMFYVLLAPVSGVIADAWPKGQVMLFSNALKIAGCFLMMSGTNPLLAYAVVGFGAALYSPAKYGLITELLPSSKLVKANGWIEGLTIISIILGVTGGGLLVSGVAIGVYQKLGLILDADAYSAGIVSTALTAIIYGIASTFNIFIPRTSVDLQPLPKNFTALISDFRTCNRRLWNDKLGQMTLATTTIFWGVSGNLRYIVLAWAGIALGFNVTQASSLLGVVAVGTAIGAILASWRVKLDHAPRFIPLGILMGFLLLMLLLVSEPWQAILILTALGGIGGFMLVPMNALLQHRGHHLMGAGRSIAVQNFNEQFCILVIGIIYSLAAVNAIDIYTIISAFSLLIMVSMMYIGIRFKKNLSSHTREVVNQLRAARGQKKS